MSESSLYPNLVDRALHYLQEHGEVDEAELCAHLFAVRPGVASAGPWAGLLRQCLAGDSRFEARATGRWALRGWERTRESLADLEFVALAICTDGPKPWRHRVVGIAALRVRGNRGGKKDSGNELLGRWSSAIRPQRARRLPAYLGDFGLGPEELETAPTFAEVAGDLLAFFGDAPIVGLDVGLAAAFLQFELRRLGRPSLTNPLIELAMLADLVLAETGRGSKPDLERLAQSLGLPAGDERRLSSRARTTADVGRSLLARAETQGLRRLADLMAALDRLSAGPSHGLDATRPRLLLDVSAGKVVPEGPGVYLLKDESGQVLYVGKAASLRRRLAGYLTTDLARSRRMSGVVEATAAIETRPTETELEAQLLEARLIAQLGPRFNVQRESGTGLVYLRRNLEATALRPKGSPRRPAWASVAAGPEGEVVGPLAPAEARRLLREARSRFRLGVGRQSASWAIRADEGWSWLLSEADRSPVAGCLVGADLQLFALLPPWPAPPVPPLRQALLAGDEDEAAPIAPDGEPPPRLFSCGKENALTPALPACGEGAGFPPACGGTAGGVDCRPDAETAESIRVVVLGRAGWLGSLTVTSGADEPQVERQIQAAATHSPPGLTTLAELGVALRWVRQTPEAVLRLRNVSQGAKVLFHVLQRAGSAPPTAS